MMMAEQRSTETTWYLVDAGEVLYQSTDILDCIEEQDDAGGRITNKSP